MLRLLLPVLLLGWAGEAGAQFWSDCEVEQAWFAATVASKHFERPNTYRERHLGVGFEHVCDDWRGVGGVIPENSKDDITLYVGAAWMPMRWRDFRGGLFGGFFTGYSRPVLPAGAFVGAWEPRRWRYYGLNLLAFPPYDKESDWLVVLQLKRLF